MQAVKLSILLDISGFQTYSFKAYNIKICQRIASEDNTLKYLRIECLKINFPITSSLTTVLKKY